MNISVEPEYRNQGIAKELLKTILFYIKDKNITLVSLHASEMGKNLYEKVGFKPTNEMRLKLDSIDINRLFWYNKDFNKKNFLIQITPNKNIFRRFIL